VLKVGVQENSTILDYGKAVHSAHEAFIKTGVMDVSIAVNELKRYWEEHSHDPNELQKACDDAVVSLNEIPEYYALTFKDWKAIDAEHQLFEKIADRPYAFKGFIDAVIAVQGKRTKETLILDLKTTNRGWSIMKKRDPLVKAQLVLYKNYWSKKFNVDPKTIKCGFMLLKRSAAQGKHCQFMPVSVGDVTTERALKSINNMLASVNRGIALKNKNSCMYCPHKGTVRCT
jgi:hypothetical protein